MPVKRTVYKLNDAKICKWSLDDQRTTLTLIDSKNNVIELDTGRESSGQITCKSVTPFTPMESVYVEENPLEALGASQRVLSVGSNWLIKAQG